MAHTPEEHLFEPTKTEWLLAGGLKELDAGERQMLLVMAETKLQEGYKPNRQETRVLDQLRRMAGNEYDPQDIRRKVKAMVTSPKKAGHPGIALPANLNKLLKRVRTHQSRANDTD